MELTKKTDNSFFENPELDFRRKTTNKNSRDIPAIKIKSTIIVQVSTLQNNG